MIKTFRVTFQEWQQFEVFVPAKTVDDAVLIAETLRHSLGTIHPITECDGGTEAFEASDVSGVDPLTKEAITLLDEVLPVMAHEARCNRNAEDARAVRLLRTALARMKGGGR